MVYIHIHYTYIYVFFVCAVCMWVRILKGTITATVTIRALQSQVLIPEGHTLGDKKLPFNVIHTHHTPEIEQTKIGKISNQKSSRSLVSLAPTAQQRL